MSIAIATAQNPGLATGALVRQRMSSDDRVMRTALVVLTLWLTVTVLLPLGALLVKSFQGADGSFVGIRNFVEYFANPALTQSIWNSLWISVLSTVICVLLSFVFAYGLTRTCMPGRSIFRMITQVPLLAPSLLPAISLVYLFGNQGIARGLLFGNSIYGPIGVVIGEVFWTLPHALIIMTTALALSDGRLYEAAEALKASAWRTFWTVTLPGARYGLISATFVVFTLVITDFGVPKVIGGQFNVLATDIYKQVIGQQNFRMGAVVGLLLLLPAVLSFFVDQWVQTRQSAALSARAVPYQPKPDRFVDTAFFVACGLIAAAILVIIGVAFFASVAKLWPNDLTPSLRNYDFNNMDGGGWESFFNSLRMAGAVALFGTATVFVGAYLVEKTRGFRTGRVLFQFLALLPLAVPGIVLGLGYIFFFNLPGNPLNFIYATLTILVVCTMSHFYSVAHLTAVTALKQIDHEVETVSSSLRVPLYLTFLRVTLPVCLPAVLEIAMYLFVNALTTVSAVVFLYSPETTLASIAVLNMDDAGDVAPAAAMAMTIFLAATIVRTLYLLVVRGMFDEDAGLAFPIGSKVDLVVVGAGIVGLAHALVARHRGLSVVVIDREAEAIGASVRNFGFVTVTGQQAGDCWRRAMRSRDIWEDVAPQAGIPVEHSCLLVVAQRPEAMAVLEAFSRTKMGGQCRLLAADETRRLHGAILADTPIEGALWSPHERRVESRHAIPRLAAWIESGLGATFLRRTLVKSVEPGKVETTAGTILAERIAVCPGDDLLTLFPECIARLGISRCRLHMLKIIPGERDFRLPGSVMSDLSLVRYLGYSELPQAAALRERLEQEQGEFLAEGIHLIAVQGSDGGLVVGDSHHHEWSPSPFARERVDALMLQELHAVLKLPGAQVVERWTGTYASLPDRLMVSDAPDPTIRLVIVTSGTGASTAFAIAEETLGELFGVA